jgi:hypothetical protein
VRQALSALAPLNRDVDQAIEFYEVFAAPSGHANPAVDPGVETIKRRKYQ